MTPRFAYISILFLQFAACSAQDNPKETVTIDTQQFETAPPPTPTCHLKLWNDTETGLPSFDLGWSTAGIGDPPTLTVTTAFFGADAPGVTMTATYSTIDFGNFGSLQDVVEIIPAERSDGQSLEEYFRENGGLTVQVTASAKWAEALECTDTIEVPFRAWEHIDEKQACTDGCQQPEALFLPTIFEADLSQEAADSMANIVVSNTYFQSNPGEDNFILTQLPLTGTPLQFTRIGQDIFSAWDTEQESDTSSVLDCSAWSQGQELIITQSYPNLGQALNIVLDSSENVQGLSYSQDGASSDQETWLHHNCFIDPHTQEDDLRRIYTLNWGEGVGDGNVWSSGVVSFQLDITNGSIVGEVETVIDPNTLTTAEYKYSNGLTLSPVGTDGVQWVGISYANENHSPADKERSFFLVFSITNDGLQTPRFLFVNEGLFDESSLTEGWQEAFPELEVVALPRDSYNNFYPIDFPHNIEFFQAREGAAGEQDVYRLIIASLGSMASENDIDVNAEVYMYDIYASPSQRNGGTSATLFCGSTLPIETGSHFDFVLPGNAMDGRDFTWVGAYTSNPEGALYWMDLWETESNKRCKYTGAQTQNFFVGDTMFARPIWSKEIDATQLYGAPISEIEIRYDAEVLAPALK